MKGFKLLLVLPLLIGCAMETASDSDQVSDDTYEYTSNGWRNQKPDVPSCKPFIRELIVNGETITVIEATQCPFVHPLDEIVNPVDEIVNPVDERVSPIDESVNSIDEHFFPIEKGFI